MDLNTKGITDFIEEIMRDAAVEIPEAMRRDIDKKRLRASGKLREIDAEIVKKATDDLVKLVVQFQKYGRYQEMKGVRHSDKGPPSKRYQGKPGLAEWVKSVGIEKFYDPGYKKKPRKIVNTDKAAERIGYGIARSIKNKSKRRARKFYIKNVYEQVYSSGGIFEKLLSGLSIESLKEMKTIKLEDFTIKA